MNVIKLHLIFLATVTCAANAATIYYTDIVTINGTAAVLKKVNSDGSGVTTLVTGLRHPRGMSLDVPGGKMYWAELGLSAIRRANLDGTGIETVVAADGGGVALDLAAQKIYWSAGFPSGQIGRSNLDGTGQENLVTNGLIHPVGVALDTLQGKLYWTDLEGNLDGTGKIQRSNLDGSNVETILTGIDEANGLAIDAVNGKIYWPEAATKRIQRANLDGSNLEDVVTGLGNPTTLDLDLVQGKIYWTDSAWNGQTNRIQRANLDGTNVETVISGNGFPWGLAVDSSGVINIKKAVYIELTSLVTGKVYQVQVSTGLNIWTNYGPAFTATNSIWRSANYFDVDNWSSLFFRFQAQ